MDNQSRESEAELRKLEREELALQRKGRKLTPKASVRLQQLRAELQNKAANVLKSDHGILEARNESEKPLLGALNEAIAKGLIVVDEGGDIESHDVCYLMASGHYTKTRVLPFVGMSQYQLFALTHLLVKHQATNPIYVEGLGKGRQMPRDEQISIGPYVETSAFDDEVQEYCVEHPGDFVSLLNRRGSQGILEGFYGLTAYQHIRGMHEDKLMKLLLSLNKRLDTTTAFQRAYVSEAGIDCQMTTVGGKKYGFFNRRVYSPDKIIEDCNQFIRFVREMDLCDKLREEEVANMFDSERHSSPMAWVGLAHEGHVVDLCKEKRLRVVSVIPKASVDARNVIRKSSCIDTSSENLPAVYELRDWATQLLQQNVTIQD